MDVSERRERLLSGSGRWTIPVVDGGKGMYWQELATQGSKVSGTQDLFHPQTEVC